MLGEGAALDALHRVVETAVGQAAELVDGHDARVLEAGQHTGLAGEAGVQLAVGFGQAEQLERHLALEQQVAHQEDRAHATAAQAAEELVALGGQLGLVYYGSQLRKLGRVKGAQLAHGRSGAGSRPSNARASSRNSASLAVRARKWSSSRRRKSRRAAARRLVTVVSGTPSAAASSR